MGSTTRTWPTSPSVLTEHEVGFLASPGLPFVKGAEEAQDYPDSLQMSSARLDVLNQMDRVICMNRHDANALVGYVPQEKLEISPAWTPISPPWPTSPPSPAPWGTGLPALPQRGRRPLFRPRPIFPLDQGRIPDAHFIVIDANPPEEIRQLHDRTDITVTGFVPGLRPWPTCAVIVAPILGLGIRVKVVRPWRWGARCRHRAGLRASTSRTGSTPPWPTEKISPRASATCSRTMRLRHGRHRPQAGGTQLRVPGHRGRLDRILPFRDQPLITLENRAAAG